MSNTILLYYKAYEELLNEQWNLFVAVVVLLFTRAAFVSDATSHLLESPIKENTITAEQVLAPDFLHHGHTYGELFLMCNDH